MKKVAFCLTTKDRVHLTRQTLPPILAEAEHFDVFWVDGSVSEEGALFAKAGAPGIAGVHMGVTGGADVAIVYSLSIMIELGYEYVGLIENDVLLEANWFERIFELFRIDGLNTGAVSARCIRGRIIERRPGYAIMANVGAGMVLFRREAAEAVLDHYRTPTNLEFAFLTEYYTGVRCRGFEQMDGRELLSEMTGDWSFESSLLSRGMVTLACIPSMATNVDVRLPIETGSTLYVGSTTMHLPPRAALPIGRFNFGLSAWSAHSHQLVKATPGCFTGDWRLVWTRYHGPFGLMTTSGAEVLQISVFGAHVSLLVNVENEGTPMSWGEPGGEMHATLAAGMRWLPFTGTMGLKLMRWRFKAPGVTVMTALFGLPQPWFRERDGLRYTDLRSFL